MSVNTSSFVLSGNSAQWNADVVVHGMNIDSDGTRTPVEVPGMVSGMCARK
jgi:hypothetical protein